MTQKQTVTAAKSWWPVPRGCIGGGPFGVGKFLGQESKAKELSNVCDLDLGENMWPCGGILEKMPWKY